MTQKTLSPTKKTRKTKVRHVLMITIGTLFLLIGFAAFCAANWYIKTYGQLGFEAILFTLLAEKSGVDQGLVQSYLRKGFYPALIYTALTSLILFVHFKFKRNLVMVWGKKKKEFRVYPFHRTVAFILSIVISLSLLMSAASQTQLFTYIQQQIVKTNIYEEYYADPATTEISFPEKKRNLIYIFLESMEITFLDTQQGGVQDVCMIPELYDYAANNVNFSPNDGVGGYYAVSGTAWTIGGMVGQSAGIPLIVPPGVQGNGYGKNGIFLNGITNLSDILHDNGYYQALMVGSDSDFGGRKTYYEQHGVDQVYDLFTAYEDDVVEDDHFVWWGIEDHHLYRYAKQELTKIAAQDQPFAFTMLTVDTHFPDGYYCEYCQEQYNEQLENVYACASRQVDEFIRWIQEQDFYENTTIVIAGDHLSMDNVYFDPKVPDGQPRLGYNCIINSAIPDTNSKNRDFTPLDMFPTTLAAMGCQIDGDRLGLGTNLFSGKETLMEIMGLTTLSGEIAKKSDYYFNNFYFENTDS